MLWSAQLKEDRCTIMEDGFPSCSAMCRKPGITQHSQQISEYLIVAGRRNLLPNTRLSHRKRVGIPLWLASCIQFGPVCNPAFGPHKALKPHRCSSVKPHTNTPHTRSNFCLYFNFLQAHWKMSKSITFFLLNLSLAYTGLNLSRTFGISAKTWHDFISNVIWSLIRKSTHYRGGFSLPSLLKQSQTLGV